MWKCVKCEIINGEHRSSCLVCSFPKEESQQIFKKAHENNMLREKEHVQPAAAQPKPIFAAPPTAPAVSSTVDNSYVTKKSSPKNTKKKLKVVICVLVSLILLCITLGVAFLIYQAMSSENTLIGDDESRSAALSSTKAATNAGKSEAEIEDFSYVDVPALGTPDGTLGEGGNALTILCWTEDDLKFMYDVVANGSGMDKAKMVYKNVGANGTEANEKYAQVFAADEDVDLYFCDADWNMDYQNNDEYSAPLSAVGITEDMYANAYDYTVDYEHCYSV